MNKLFSSSVATVTVNPFTALEALQEITDICNSIQLSTPAFEALMELPSLVREFDNASPPMLAMLNFVAEQHYGTLGLTNVSVSQESVVDTVVNGAKKAYEWVKKKVGELKNWFMSFFRKKPVEQMQANVKQAEEVVRNSVALIDIVIKDVQSGKPVKLPETIEGLNSPIPSHAGTPIMNVVKEVIRKPDVTVQELQEVRKNIINTSRVISDLKGIMPHLVNITKDIMTFEPVISKLTSEVEQAMNEIEKGLKGGKSRLFIGEYSFSASQGEEVMRELSRIKGIVIQIGQLVTTGPILLGITDEVLKKVVKVMDHNRLIILDKVVTDLKANISRLMEGMNGIISELKNMDFKNSGVILYHPTHEENIPEAETMVRLIGVTVNILKDLKES